MRQKQNVVFISPRLFFYPTIARKTNSLLDFFIIGTTRPVVLSGFMHAHIPWWKQVTGNVCFMCLHINMKLIIKSDPALKCFSRGYNCKSQAVVQYIQINWLSIVQRIRMLFSVFGVSSHQRKTRSEMWLIPATIQSSCSCEVTASSSLFLIVLDLLDEQW